MSMHLSQPTKFDHHSAIVVWEICCRVISAIGRSVLWGGDIHLSGRSIIGLYNNPPYELYTSPMNALWGQDR